MASCSVYYMPMEMEAKSQHEVTTKQGPLRQKLSKRVIAFVVFLGILICAVVILQFCFKRSERANKVNIVRNSNDSNSTMTPPCSGKCTITLVESIPENLKFPAGSVRHPTIYDGWMRLLKVAEKSIDIASFYWTLRGVDTNTSDPSTQQGEDVFQGLREAGKRGVKIRIVQSSSDDQFENLDTAILQKQGLAQVRSLNVTRLIGNGILHTKMWLVDGKHFYVGSANLDWRALTQIQELGFMSYNCSCMSADMLKIFNVYWDLATPHSKIPVYWPEKYKTNINADSPAQIIINGSNSAAVFLASSPPKFCPPGRTDDLSAILQVINSATKFVYVAVMDYFPTTLFLKPRKPRTYWPVIDDALRKAAFDRRVKVRVMASQWNHTRHDMMFYLRSLASLNKANNASIKVGLYKVPPISKEIPYSRVNHNKFMVTESVAYVGTSNWSADYFTDTGGISYVISETESGNSVRAQLQAVFERNWNSSFTTLIYCQEGVML